MDYGISGKSAVVCGASSGIGRAVALEFAKQGVRLTICSRREDELKAATLAIKEQSKFDEIIPVRADVSKKEDVDDLISRAVTQFGGVDLLFTNAAGPKPMQFLDTTDQDWINAFQMTLMSVVYLSRACIPVMKQRGGGSIVNIVSISVKQPVQNLVLSNSLRMAVVGLAKTLSTELAKYNIRVNNVCPGFTKTPRAEALVQDTMKREGISKDEATSRLLSDVPFKRMAEPEEVASLVAFLCSDQAKFITGSTIFVDGGAVKSAL